MSELRPYPQYKGSGVEWLGTVPEHWEILPFFSRFTERKESNKGMLNSNLLSLSYGRVVRRDIDSLDGLLPASFETYQIVHSGDMVFRLTDLQNDKRSLRSALVGEKGIITSAYLCVKPTNFDSVFSSYVFRAYDLTKVFYSMGGGLRQSMKYDDMKWLPLVAPSLQEQTQIAAFLDHETDKIDALIEEQKRLIELLQEKRQAVISHAVTKGLDPNAPMKDSGVEWLGEVPEHWEVKPLKRVAKQLTQKTYASDFPVGLENIESWTGRFIYTGSEFSGDGVSFNEGDILFGKLRPYLAKVWRASNSGQAVGDFFVISPSKINGAYLQYFILTPVVIDILNSSTIGAKMPRVSWEDMACLAITVPPEEEQFKIIAFLDKQIAAMNSLVNESETAISLLKERRSALISAAVTGKIDVRNWQAPAEKVAS